MAGGPGSTGETGIGALTRVRLTRLGKVLYPAAQITKADVLAYYIRVAPILLPFLHSRPLTMHRFPDGVDGGGFFEKDAPAGTPEYVEIFTRYSETADRDVHFVLCNNLDTLIWIANLASLEIHTTLSTTGSYESPDLLLFDIDPEPPLTFDDVIDVAMVVREELEAAGLRSYVKTSGKKGVHIVVPLVPGYRFGEIREFAHGIGKKIARSSPRVVSEFPRSRDPGTVFIDYLQNAHGRTMIAPYSLRATPGATVSSPVRWEELRHGVRPEDFNIKTVLSRAEEPWRGILDTRQKI
ncbi:non-homologous end-joining DNA ligase [Methanoregula sp.]|uniref:non-homologous end-joining DNA ligase n=1 Tax=Methanoregula sp. TaxID=2052170 RepID=UPI003C71CF50